MIIPMWILACQTLTNYFEILDNTLIVPTSCTARRYCDSMTIIDFLNCKHRHAKLIQLDFQHTSEMM